MDNPYGRRVLELAQELSAGNVRALGRMAKLANSANLGVFLSRAREDPARTLSPETVDKLVENLGVTRDWLMAGSGPKYRAGFGPDRPVPDVHEVEAVDPTSPGRWKLYATRYWTFRAQATVARGRGTPEYALDAAADYLGANFGDGPTEEQAATAIQRYAQNTEAARLPPGREAQDSDLPKPKRRRT